MLLTHSLTFQLQRGTALVLGILVANLAYAEIGATIEPVGFSELVKVVGGLAIVLFAIGGAAWFARRMNGLQRFGGHQIRIVDGISLGARERILLLEVKDHRVLVGLTSGRMQALHVFQEHHPETQSFDDTLAAVAKESTVADKLK